MANLFAALPEEKQKEMYEWIANQERETTKKEIGEKLKELSGKLGGKGDIEDKEGAIIVLTKHQTELENTIKKQKEREKELSNTIKEKEKELKDLQHLADKEDKIKDKLEFWEITLLSF